jgi:hypothetical protein
MNWIVKLNKTLEPYYALLITLGLFATLLLSLYKFIFSPTDLKVNVQTAEMNYPSSIGNAYKNVFKTVAANDSIATGDAALVYGFILQTTEQKTIMIENVSDKTLRDVTFKHLYTDDITAYSISSDFFNQDEEKNLYENLVYDENRSITYLKQLIDLPPKKSIKIKLWGSFKKSLITNDVLVSHSDGDAFFDKTYSISGLKGYFVQYIYEFLVILILIFITIYHYGLKYALDKSTKENSE